MPFPQIENVKKSSDKKDVQVEETVKSNFFIEGLALIAIGFTSTARFLFIYPLISLVTLIAMFMLRTETICIIGGFIIGFSAAGGVLQLAVSTMSDLFPVSKGKITSMVMMASSIATFSVTAIAGFVTQTMGTEYTLLLAAIVTAVGVLLSIVVNIRYNQLSRLKKK